jgi:hypothetical protein
MVYQNIAHSGRFSPHLVGVLLSKLRGKRSRSLTNDLQVMENPDPQHLIVVEGRSPSGSFVKDMIDSFQDVS